MDGWVKRGGKLLNPAVKMCLSVTLQFKHPYLVALSLMDASSIHSQTCAQRCERLPHGYVPTRFLNDLIGPCMSHSYAFPTFNEMVHFLSSGWYFAFLAASPLLLWFSLLGTLCSAQALVQTPPSQRPSSLPSTPSHSLSHISVDCFTHTRIIPCVCFLVCSPDPYHPVWVCPVLCCISHA